jgi:hypothetical protein
VSSSKEQIEKLVDIAMGYKLNAQGSILGRGK